MQVGAYCRTGLEEEDLARLHLGEKTWKKREKLGERTTIR